VFELALGRLDAVELVDRHVLGQVNGACTFEAGQPGVDAAPAGAHKVDEQREIVNACMAFREEVALDPFEASDRLIQETADLGDVACHREDLGA
jgi:hypothetical protein